MTLYYKMRQTLLQNKIANLLQDVTVVTKAMFTAKCVYAQVSGQYKQDF